MAQLKRLIGIPDDRIEWADSKSELAGDAVPDSFTEMQALSANQLRLLRLASEQYLYASATSVSIHESALNRAISLVHPVVTAAVFGDIMVESDAVIEIDSSIDVIVASRITVRPGGTIRIKGNHIKFDCRRLQSES